MKRLNNNETLNKYSVETDKAGPAVNKDYTTVKTKTRD